MKRFPLFVAAFVLITAVFISIQRTSEAPGLSSDRSGDDSRRESSAASSADLPSGGDAVPMVPRAERLRRMERGAALLANRQPEALLVAQEEMPRRSLLITPEFVAGLVNGPDEVSIVLPDGRTAVGVIERRFMADDGKPEGVEGYLLKPSEGRFVFRLQPEGDLAGPVTGHILFNTDPKAYRALKGGDGKSYLTELPKGEVICLLPAAPETAETAGDDEPQEIPAEHPSNIPIPAYQNGVIPLQSMPGTTGVIYLDFDGEPGPHEGWGNFDALPSGATNSQIREVWARVAEDFAPFKLNVTTDLRVFLDAPKNSRQRCIVTPTKNAAPTAGGVAFLGSFNSTGDSPCWAFYSTGKNSAEVISHEIGHTLGLSHDGRNITPKEEYYGGHGTGTVAWAPIMGVGYSRNLTQWSKGEYTNANQLQNDLNIIVSQNNSVAYRTDDAGPAHDTAAELEIFGSGTVDDEGTISHYSDVDAFRFTTTGGALNLAISPVAQGPNLDISAAIYDAAGNPIIVDNPDTALNATLSTTLAAGEYTVRVEGVGRGDPLTTGYSDYGSLGQYTITGTIAGTTGPTRLTIAENAALGAGVGTPTPRNDHGAASLTWAITAGNTNSAFTINPTTGRITVATASVLDYEGLGGNWIDPPIFNLTVSITNGADSALNETLPVVVTVTDVNETPTLLGASFTVLSRTLPGTVLGRLTASDPDRFDFPSYSIVGGNAGGKFAVNAAGEITAAGSWEDIGASHMLTVRVTDQGTPSLTAEAVVQISVVPIPASYAPGEIYRTMYDNISGSAVSSLTGSASFPLVATREFRITDFTDNTRGDNYGSTIRAWLIAPVTGKYRFWISGDDSTELHFNSAANPAAASVIAYRTSATGYQTFTASTTQQSSLISLNAGQVCYIEARQKEASGGDHVSVAWEIKDASDATIQAREVIPGRYLSPHRMNYSPRVTSAESVVYRNAYQGATAARAISADVNAGQSVSWSITGGNAGGLFSIDPATGRIFVSNAAGLAGSSATTIPITVRATDDGSPALNGSGTITLRLRDTGFVTTAGLVQEFWDNVSGNTLSGLYNLPRYQADRPDRLANLSSFDSGEDVGNNYGARIRAFVSPPTSGAYRFYIASDDYSVLRLSTDTDPANATQIASVSGSTDHLDWDAQTSQTSEEVNLVAGQKYFIEAIVKEGTGGDHVAVAWTGPGITTITVLGDGDTEPYDSNQAPAFAATSYQFTTISDPLQGVVIGSVGATDAPFEEVCYAIVSGNSAGNFAIDPVTGGIRIATSNGLVTGATYQLQVGAQDTGHGRNFAPRATLVPVTINVSGPDQPPQFPNSPSLGSYVFDQPLSIDLTTFVSDPGDTLTFSLLSGPAGLSLSPSGILTGTPGAAAFGENDLTILVSDTHSHTVQGTLKLTITGSPPVAASTLALSGAAGTMISGTVNSGSAADTATANNASFILREANSGTNPNQLSLLDYQWIFTAPANRFATLKVKAHHSSNTEDDHFQFSVSTDGGATFQNAVLVTTTAYSSLIQNHTFATGGTGQVIVKVVDTDRTPGRSALHNLAIDMMNIEIMGNEPPVLTNATFNTVPHATIGTVLGTVQGSAGDAGQTLAFSITGGNTAGLFAIGVDGKLTVSGDVPVSQSSYRLTVAGVDSGLPPLTSYAVVTVNVENSLAVADANVLAWSSGTHTYQSVVNNGTLRLADPAMFNVSGTFTNNGVLDLIHWSGTLPQGFVNNGTILDRSSLKTHSPAKSGTTFQFMASGYAGHLYQLKTSTSLSGPWTDSGSPVTGTGTPGSPQEIPFSAPAIESQRFYRIEVTPAF